MKINNETIISEIKKMGDSYKEEEFLGFFKTELEMYIDENLLQAKVKAEKKEKMYFIEWLPMSFSGISTKMKKKFRLLSLNSKLAALSLALLIMGTGGVAMASRDSLPDDALYPIKLLSEDARLVLSFSSESKARLGASFANERITEIEKVLQERGVEPKGLEIALSYMEENAKRSLETINEKEKRGEDIDELKESVDNNIEGQKERLRFAFREYTEVSEENKTKLRLFARNTQKERNIFVLSDLLDDTSEEVTPESDNENLDDKNNEEEDGSEGNSENESNNNRNQNREQNQNRDNENNNKPEDKGIENQETVREREENQEEENNLKEQEQEQEQNNNGDSEETGEKNQEKNGSEESSPTPSPTPSLEQQQQQQQQQ